MADVNGEAGVKEKDADARRVRKLGAERKEFRLNLLAVRVSMFGFHFDAQRRGLHELAVAH